MKLRPTSVLFSVIAAMLTTPLALPAQAPVTATVLPSAGGPIAVTIGHITVTTNVNGRITGTFNFAGGNPAIPQFPDGFAFLDDWYDFRWINILTDYRDGLGNQVLNGAGQPIDPALGVLPALDPQPAAAGGDDNLPYYYTNFEWNAGVFPLPSGTPINTNNPAGPASRFIDVRHDPVPNAVITFETYLVVKSITDPTIAQHEIVVLDGFRWTYDAGATPVLNQNGGVLAGGTAVATHLATLFAPSFFNQAPLTQLTTALNPNAGGGGFPPPAGAGTPAWEARFSGLGPVGRTIGACPAVVETIPPGCLEEWESFYEEMDPSTMDLSGLTISGINTASGGPQAYTITTAPGTMNPIGSVGTPQVVPLGDDDVQPVGSHGLHVSSNGNIYFGPGGTISFSPSVFELLVQPVDGIYSWTDLEPNNPLSGQIHYEESTTTAMVTYDGVFGWGTSNPNSFQMEFDFTTDDWSITYGVLASTNPENWLVGYSPAGFSGDPGPVDISNTVVHTAPFDRPPLTLIGLNAPIQGQTANQIDLLTTDMGVGLLIHIGIVGLQSPGTPLDPFGLSNVCRLHASLDVLVGPVVTGLPDLVWTALTIPASTPTSFVGFQFYVQAATMNAGGLNLQTRTSNGLRYVVGSL